MALENIKEIEEALGVEVGTLEKAITTDEAISIDLSNRVILDKSAYETRLENIKKETATTALEMAVKEQRTALGLDFTGKNMENLVKAIKEKTEAESKIEPEERYKSLKSDFEKLQSNLIEKENEFNLYKTNIDTERTLSEIKGEFIKNIPDNVLVSKSTIFTEAKEKGFSFVKEDGVVVVKDKNGQVVKDQNFSPIAVDVWVKEFSAPYVSKPQGGSGNGDEPTPPKAGSWEAFEKEASKNGWNDLEKNQELSKRIKDGTLKL